MTILEVLFGSHLLYGETVQAGVSRYYSEDDRQQVEEPVLRQDEVHEHAG